jgi:non-lysosomal glucosylceramidase
LKAFLLFAIVLLVPTVAAHAQEDKDYGAQQANSRFVSKAGSDGDVFPNYLALHDANGPSGVPLGGIGVGAVDLAPDGHFTRFAINNWSSDGVDMARRDNPSWDREAFLAVWEKDSSGHVVIRRLQRDRATLHGMSGYAHSTYRGLFPTATLAFDDDRNPQPHSLVSVFAHSGLVPQNVKDSSLPGFWIEVTLANSDSKSVETSVALSWPDLIGRGVYDIAAGQEKDGYSGPFRTEKLVPISPPSTQVEPMTIGDLHGLHQFTRDAISIRQATYQNYIDGMAILAEAPAGGSLSSYASWNSSTQDDAWKKFGADGSFPSQAGSTILSWSDQPSSASIVSIKAVIGPGGKQTFRFLVSWSIPGPPSAAVQFGTQDYGHFFQNHFTDFTSLLTYEIQNRGRILNDTLAWQQPILDSTMPDWLKFKLINSAYTLYTNTILNKAGSFSIMEGGMGGLSGTMDQRLAAHPIYQKFFTPLDHAELQQFANTQDEDGGILHFDGSYFVGLADDHGHTPVPHEKMIDNTAGWLIQVAKDYQQTGDSTFARKNSDRIRRAYAYMKAQIRDASMIPVGAQTYDDFPHPEISIYTGTVYLAALQAGEVLGRAIADQHLSSDSQAQFQQTQTGLIHTLWNGHFFAYGSDVGGANRRDDRLFGGQLAGQFFGRYSGWGDALPPDQSKSSIEEQLRTAVAGSPDFYAPKVWDLEMKRGVDMPGSRTWPFYLESYTAMTAIQMGYVSDGLEIMRHIQLVHLRNGWEWTQNLWNPAELTYVSAPVTWFAPDVLTNASLDLPEGRITLGPALLPGQKRTVIPLYFPRFWASLEYAPSENKATLHILKTFDGTPIILKKLTIEPIGAPSSLATTVDLPPFTVKTGSVLDLSKFLPTFEKVQTHEPILDARP